MYVGDWSDWSDVSKNFTGTWDKPETPAIEEPNKVIFAGYEMDGYDGSAMVVYRHGRKYYTVEGSHCSCHGLEGQWEPEEYPNKKTLIAALQKRADNYGAFGTYKNQILEALKAK